MHESLCLEVTRAAERLEELSLCHFGGGRVSLGSRRLGILLLSGASPDDSVQIVTMEGQLIAGDGPIRPEFFMLREVYEAFGSVNAVILSNPIHAASFAQAGRPIKPYGITHARLFGDAIPCTRKLLPSEIKEDLPLALGRLIVETMRTEEAWVREVGSLLLCTGEACTMGSDLSEALTRMQALESLAQMALFTEILQKNGASGGTRMPEDLLRTLYSDAQK